MQKNNPLFGFLRIDNENTNPKREKIKEKVYATKLEKRDLWHIFRESNDKSIHKKV